MTEATTDEHVKKLRDLAASHSYQEALLAGADALEHLASRPRQGVAERLVDALCTAPRGDSSLLIRFVQAIERLSVDPASLASGVQRIAGAQGAAALELQTKSSPKVLAEAWGIVGSDDKLVEVSDIDGPLLFYKECDLMEEIRSRMAADEHVVRVQVVVAPRSMTCGPVRP